MSHRTHVVRQGECVASIAAHYGIPADSLWNDAGNDALRAKRSDRHALAPGDVVQVPAVELAEFSVGPGGSYTFKARVPTCMLRLTLRESSVQVMSNRPYVLEVAGRSLEGSTDGDGKLEVAVPAKATLASLTVWPDGSSPSSGEGHRFELQIGHLDPIETADGVRMRLEGLGFSTGDETGPELGAEAALALRMFQGAQGLTQNGEADQTTKDKLREVFGA